MKPRGGQLKRLSEREQRQAECLVAYAECDLGKPVKEFLAEFGVPVATWYNWMAENANGFRDKWAEVQEARRQIPLDLVERQIGRLLSKTFRDAMGEVHSKDCKVSQTGECTCPGGPLETTGDAPSKKLIFEAVGLTGPRRRMGDGYKQDQGIERPDISQLPEIIVEIKKRAEFMLRFAERQKRQDGEGHAD